MRNYPENGVLIAFGELFLKSEGVKRIFKKILTQNISFFLKKENIDFKICESRERIFIATEQTRESLRVIKRISGIAWLAECLFFPEANLKEISEFVAENYENWVRKSETFAIRLKLENGVFKESREGVIEKIAEKINRKVNLSKPKREIFIEIRKAVPPSPAFSGIGRAKCFLYFKKIKGAGGYPVGSAGKVLTLISGGIDSPVAAFLAARRGVENVWLHFHSFPLVSNVSIEKIKDLAKIFLKYQTHLKIYFIPFQAAQVEIKTKTPPQSRILLYRRLMLKIAEIIAKKENCRALVTGESLGQVSSQTLPNIEIVEEAVKMPVLRPLIAMDKEEIIKMAKKIGTFEISIKPQGDCCTLFVPKHPTAAGNLKIVKELESKIKTGKLIKGAIKGMAVERALRGLTTFFA